MMMQLLLPVRLFLLLLLLLLLLTKPRRRGFGTTFRGSATGNGGGGAYSGGGGGAVVHIVVGTFSGTGGGISGCGCGGFLLLLLRVRGSSLREHESLRARKCVCNLHPREVRWRVDAFCGRIVDARGQVPVAPHVVRIERAAGTTTRTALTTRSHPALGFGNHRCCCCCC